MAWERQPVLCKVVSWLWDLYDACGAYHVNCHWTSHALPLTTLAPPSSLWRVTANKKPSSLGGDKKGYYEIVGVCPQAQRWPWLSAAAVHAYLAMAHKSKVARKLDEPAKSELTEETQGPKIENKGQSLILNLKTSGPRWDMRCSTWGGKKGV
jgi:hypothetical protein